MSGQLNLQSYTPEHIGRPVEHMGQMMKQLDENNRRIASTYQGLHQALESVELGPGDEHYLEERRNSLKRTMDQIASSDNYGYSEGLLNREIRNIVSDKAITASQQRYRKYRENKDKLADWYYRGGSRGAQDMLIDKEQYDFYSNQPYQPTKADEHGYFNTEYDEFRTPARAVNVPKYLSDILSQIQTTTTTDGAPTVKYLTHKDRLELAGYDTSGLDPVYLNSNSPILDYVIYNGKRVREPEKIRDVLTGMLTADPNVKAYLEDLTYIRQQQSDPNTSISDIINDYIDPMVKAGTIDDSLGRVSMNTQQMSHAIKSIPTSEEEELIPLEGGISTPFAINRTEVKDSYKPINDNLVGHARRWLKGTGDEIGKGRTYKEIQPDDKYYYVINSLSNNIFDKDYNTLTQEERAQFELSADKFFENLEDELRNISTIRNPTRKNIDEITENLFGTTSFSIKKGDIENFGIHRPIYSAAHGKVINSEEMREYLADKYKGKTLDLGIDFNGYLTSPLLSVLTDDLSFTQPQQFTIGGDVFIIGSSHDQSKRIEYAQASLYSAIENNLHSAFKDDREFGTTILQDENRIHLSHNATPVSITEEIVPKVKASGTMETKKEARHRTIIEALGNYFNSIIDYTDEYIDNQTRRKELDKKLLNPDVDYESLMSEAIDLTE